MKLNEFVQAWHGDHLEAAAREGWVLCASIKSGAIVESIIVQRIDDPEGFLFGYATVLPDDASAKRMVRTGTGLHHRAARLLIYANFPAEWEALEKAVTDFWAAPAMPPTTLSLLRTAVQAKIACWSASRALEVHLGLDDVPDDINKVIQNAINDLAMCYPEDVLDMSAVTGEHVDQLLVSIEKVK